MYIFESRASDSQHVAGIANLPIEDRTTVAATAGKLNWFSGKRGRDKSEKNMCLTDIARLNVPSSVLQ